MTATGSDSQTASPEIATHADAALQVVRIVLAVLSCFVVVAYRPLTGPPSWAPLAGTIAAIIASVLVLNWMGRRATPRPSWLWLTQALDVGAIVALAIVLDEPLGQQSWALLVVPVVSAAIRHGAAASTLAWAGGSGAYVLAAFAGLVRSNDDFSLILRIPGTLLAVAITVGLLARWMREGWDIQNGLTAAVATREQRMAVIERTGQALQDLSSEEAMLLCANQTLALGFQAATVEGLDVGGGSYAVGDRELVSRPPSSDRAVPAGPTVTVWMHQGTMRVHSVAVHEPRTNTLVTGWSEESIDQDAAQAVARLVAHTSTAIETSMLLSQLRHTSAHDPLTGLANRRTLDQRLEQQVREPGCVSVAFVDLDNFKEINDRHGHDVGDMALNVIARRLESAAGPNGLVARYGGDEFVIMLPNADGAAAAAVAEHALAASLDPIAVGQTQVSLGLSIGIATARTPVVAADLVRAADQAVYRAKAAGKGVFETTDLDSAAADRPAGLPAGA